MKSFLKEMGATIGAGACQGGACYLLFLAFSRLLPKSSASKYFQVTIGVLQMYFGIGNISGAFK